MKANGNMDRDIANNSSEKRAKSEPGLVRLLREIGESTLFAAK